MTYRLTRLIQPAQEAARISGVRLIKKMDTHFQIIHATAVGIAVFFYIRNHYRLRRILEQHDRPLAHPFLSTAIFMDFKEAKRLIAELDTVSDKQIVKSAMRKTDVSAVLVPITFLGLAIIFMAI